MIFFRIISAIAQIWGWVGVGYYWHAHQPWAQLSCALIAILASVVVSAMDIASETGDK